MGANIAQTAPQQSGRFNPTRHVRGKLIAGFLILVPILITYGVLSFVFNSLDKILQPIIQLIFGRPVPGLGFGIIILVAYVAGLIAATYIGRWIISAVQAGLLRVPVYNTIYSASKQLVESFSGTGRTGFRRVVEFEYPRRGTWTIGFLTNTIEHEDGQVMGVVYIPTAPTPNSGYVAIVSLDEVYDLDMPVERALRFCLSGGIVSPSKFTRRPAVPQTP
ncbi:MAG: DUF502 domain-containing protein [Chloroflexi bacterium]|nr:DUF502 domain-containing protein [Chloroflexota bacterium]